MGSSGGLPHTFLSQGNFKSSEDGILTPFPTQGAHVTPSQHWPPSFLLLFINPLEGCFFVLVLVVQMSVCIRGTVLELLGAIPWLPEGTQDPCELGLFASALVSSSAMFCPLDNTRLSHGRHIPAGCWAFQWTCWGSCRKLKAEKTTQQDEMQ